MLLAVVVGIFYLAMIVGAAALLVYVIHRRLKEKKAERDKDYTDY